MIDLESFYIKPKLLFNTNINTPMQKSLEDMKKEFGDKITQQDEEVAKSGKKFKDILMREYLAQGV